MHKYKRIQTVFDIEDIDNKARLASKLVEHLSFVCEAPGSMPGATDCNGDREQMSPDGNHKAKTCCKELCMRYPKLLPYFEELSYYACSVCTDLCVCVYAYLKC